MCEQEVELDVKISTAEDSRPYNWLTNDETLVKMREVKREELERNMNEIINSGGVEELSRMRCPEIYIKKVRACFVVVKNIMLSIYSMTVTRPTKIDKVHSFR